jgi:hypothetical protein
MGVHLVGWVALIGKHILSIENAFLTEISAWAKYLCQLQLHGTNYGFFRFGSFEHVASNPVKSAL